MIRAASVEEIEFVCDRVGYAPSKGAKGVVIMDKQDIGAAAIYDHWTHSAVQMHAYSISPKFIFNPDFCREIFTYPFIQCKKTLAFTVTPCDNSASLALARFLGFVEVYRIENGWRIGTDMVIQELRRENCRFLEIIDGGSDLDEPAGIERLNS